MPALIWPCDISMWYPVTISARTRRAPSMCWRPASQPARRRRRHGAHRHTHELHALQRERIYGLELQTGGVHPPHSLHLGHCQHLTVGRHPHAPRRSCPFLSMCSGGEDWMLLYLDASCGISIASTGKRFGPRWAGSDLKNAGRYFSLPAPFVCPPL